MVFDQTHPSVRFSRLFIVFLLVFLSIDLPLSNVLCVFNISSLLHCRGLFAFSLSCPVLSLSLSFSANEGETVGRLPLGLSLSVKLVGLRIKNSGDKLTGLRTC
ncbi:hypothetical protein Scep_009689 [Stephania cephalantha]|uniref:Uncharacterized protein n=1 Tax=Stephania cephalantha TaxID=152367 RepID=A0AAP0JTM2_9MAGN